ncbi:hypothetical protein EWH99_02660 [Sporolactobacillus sp. THM7-7]|nr:hypothetical protein EWH99_02660 [Sporolactobacillus sp. THM7-7]
MSKSKRLIAIALGIAIFSAELSFGIWMAHWNHFIPGDALSRVANAYYVLFSRDPHLAAIGFVWNPLPSLLMLPILIIKPLFPELASEGIAGIILTALCASLTAVHLFKSFIRRENSLFLSIGLVMLFAFNPFIFLYGSNGMSEMIFVFFLVWCVTAFLDWTDSKSVISLIFIGFSLAFAFFTRYESIFFGGSLAVSLTLIIWSRRRTSEQNTYRITCQKLEASELIALLPVVYSGIIWLVLNWSIMGDSLFFLRSSYSNLAQSEGLIKNPTIGPVIGDLGASLLFLVQRSAPFLIPLAAIIVMRLMRKKLLKSDFYCLLLFVFSIPLMQLIMLYRGASYGWLRFFVYPMPLVVAWLPYELKKQKEHGRRYYIVGGCITAITLAVCAYTTGYVMNNIHLAPEEYHTIHYKDSPIYQSNRLSKKIASDLDQLLLKEPNASVLMDSFNAFQIILSTKRSNQFVITSDRDFNQSLKDPFKKSIDYILVPKPDGVATLNAVNERYKNFYGKGAAFAKLEKEYGNTWRLYRVVDPAKKKRIYNREIKRIIQSSGHPLIKIQRK